MQLCRAQMCMRTYVCAASPVKPVLQTGPAACRASLLFKLRTGAKPHFGLSATQEVWSSATLCEKTR